MQETDISMCNPPHTHTVHDKTIKFISTTATALVVMFIVPFAGTGSANADYIHQPPMYHEINNVERVISTEEKSPSRESTSFLVDKADTKETNGKEDAKADLLNGFISGSFVRISKDLVLHPIDTVKTRLQVRALANSSNTATLQPPSTTPTSTNPTFSTIISSSKTQTIPIFTTSTTDNTPLFSNLYSGVIPSIVGGIPSAAVFFGVKDFAKTLFKEIGIAKPEATILAVTLASVPYWLIRNPAEVLKVKGQSRKRVNTNLNKTTTNLTTQQYKSTNTKKNIRNILPTNRYRPATANLASNSAINDIVTATNPDLQMRLTAAIRQRNISAIVQELPNLYNSYSVNFAYALPADVIKFLACKSNV